MFIHQDIRESTLVPLTPYGCLHDYVPFYFAPRSPMLYAIHRNNVDGYTGGQKLIIHLVSSVQKVIKNECAYVFTDGHGIMFFTEFFNRIEDLSKIDWNIMVAKYWGDTNEDGDRKRRRMAEFLVHRSFNWPMIIGIGVINEQIAQKVSDIIDGHTIKYKPQIKVKKDWYY